MLTVVILTKNESKNLTELLPNLSWVDRLIVVDDYSDDDTAIVAKKYGAKVYSRKLANNFAAQRNFGLRKAKTKWVMFLDADEVISSELKEEITSTIKSTNEFDGYFIKRRDNFAGKILKHGETGRAEFIRLAVKGAGIWRGKVHEIWDIKKSSKLENEILHFSHNSYSQLVVDVEKYAKIEARSRYKDGIEWSLFELLAYPMGKFLRDIFLWFGILDGWRGVQVALAMAKHSAKVRVELMRCYYPRSPVSTNIKLFRIFIWAIFASLAMGQLFRFELGLFPAIYGFEILMLFGIVMWLIGLFRLFRLKIRVYFPPYALEGGLWILVLAVSLIVNTSELNYMNNLRASLYWWRLVLYGGFFLSMWDSVVRGWWRVDLQKLLIYLGVWWAFLGWLQYLIIPDTRFLWWYGWDDHYFRMIGNILDPGFFGLLLVLSLILLEKKLWKRHILAYMFVFSAMILSYARSAYLTYLMSISTLMVLKKKWASLILRISLLIVSVAILMSLPSPGGESVNLLRTYSINSRARSVVTAYDLFRENPYMGVGFNRYPQIIGSTIETNIINYHPSSPDNSYMLLLSTTGIIGLAAFTIFGIKVLRIHFGNSYVFVSVIAVGVHALSNNSLFYVYVMMWMIFLLASQAKKTHMNNKS